MIRTLELHAYSDQYAYNLLAPDAVMAGCAGSILDGMQVSPLHNKEIGRCQLGMYCMTWSSWPKATVSSLAQQCQCRRALDKLFSTLISKIRHSVLLVAPLISIDLLFLLLVERMHSAQPW
eukprot:scaffold224605_cov15-Tisochrysis_lutea.AAC.1